MGIAAWVALPSQSMVAPKQGWDGKADCSPADVVRQLEKLSHGYGAEGEAVTHVILSWFFCGEPVCQNEDGVYTYLCALEEMLEI